MTLILNQLPFSNTDTLLSFPNGEAHVRPFQIVVWVSVTPAEMLQLQPNIPRLPAVLDTGHNHNFAVRPGHLENWAGLAPDSLIRCGTVFLAGQEIPLVKANLWLHANEKGRLTTKAK